MRCAGADLRLSATTIERIMNALRSLGQFFKSLGEAFQRWAQEIEDFLKRLSRQHPDWRKSCES